MRALFKFGRHAEARARADKNLVYIKLGVTDKKVSGIGHADLILVCDNNVEAADWVSYINRQLPFTVELKTTFEGE